VNDEDVISLQDYLVVLKRQRLVVLITVCAVVVAALAVSFVQTPVYEAETDLTIQPVQTSQSGISTMVTTRQQAGETDRVLATSRPVAERAATELGMSPEAATDGMRAQLVGETSVLRIIASDTDPARAAAKADAFAEAYLEFMIDEAVETVVGAQGNVRQRIEGLRERLNELDEQIEATSGEAQRQAEIERQAIDEQLTQLIEQGAFMGDAAQSISGGGYILESASIPTSPVSPRPVRTGALALVLGLLLGVGLAFLRDHIDDVIRDEEDFKRSTGGLPVLGRIPTWEDEQDSERLATVVHPTSLVTEAYRELSAGLRFMLVTHGGPEESPSLEVPDPQARRFNPGRVVMVASANANEGKTSTAANLAVSAARVGLRTILVDADLRRSTVHKRCGMGRSTGLCDILLGEGHVADHVLDVGVENLLVLPAGTIPPNPAELLASPAMRALQHRLQRDADLVIYDSPAVLAVPDALELGRFVDLAILVGRVGSTTRRQLSAAIERFEQVGTDLAGTVLNGIDSRSDGYYYSYYYQEVEEPAASRSSGRRRRVQAPPPPSVREERASQPAPEPVDEGLHAQGNGSLFPSTPGDEPDAAAEQEWLFEEPRR
jgi:polysaccharide biosynthesis transport protein